MKTWPVLAAVAMMIGSTAMAADPVEGIYKTQPDDNGNYGHVEIYACGDRLCGVIRKAFDGSGTEIESPNVGKRMIWDMAPRGRGRYAGGKIWAPDRNKTYKSEMVLDGSTLSVSGCVLVFCRSQTWTRVK